MQFRRLKNFKNFLRQRKRRGVFVRKPSPSSKMTRPTCKDRLGKRMSSSISYSPRRMMIILQSCLASQVSNYPFTFISIPFSLCNRFSPAHRKVCFHVHYFLTTRSLVRKFVLLFADVKRKHGNDRKAPLKKSKQLKSIVNDEEEEDSSSVLSDSSEGNKGTIYYIQLNQIPHFFSLSGNIFNVNFTNGNIDFVSLHTLLINTLYSIHYFSILLLAMFITLNLLPVSFNWHIQMHVIMMTLVLSSVSLYCKNQSLAACSMGAMYLFNILKVNTIMICFDPPLISILDSSVDSYRMKKSSKSPTSSSSSRHLVKPSNTDDLSGRRRGNCSLQFWQVHTSWQQAF